MKSKWLTMVAGAMLVAGLALVAAPQTASADDCNGSNLWAAQSAITNGYWSSNTPSTWACYTTGWVLANAGQYPGQFDSNDTVYLRYPVTLNASVTLAALYFGVTPAGLSATGNGTLIFDSSSRTLTVNGAVTIGSSSNTGSIDMTNGGTLIANSFTVTYGGTWAPGAGTVQLQATNTLPSSWLNPFNNLTINGGTTTSTGRAFTVGNNLTVTQGNLILQATDADYVVTNDLTVSANGTLTHSVYWDGTTRLLKVSGNIAIDGVFAYTVRSHVQMSSPSGSQTRTVRTGTNSSSAFSILTLVNGGTSSTVNASGTLKVNDNFWAGFNSNVSFHTNGNVVTAGAGLLNAGGTVFIDGGSLNVTGGLQIGAGGSNGTVNFSSGTLTADLVNVGDGARTGTLSQSGGTANIGTLTIYPTSGNAYTCSNTPTINISGNWTNNRAATAFTAASSTVTMNGGGAQTIGGTAGTTFNNLTINGGSTTTTGVDVAVNGTLTIAGALADNGKTITAKGNIANSGTHSGAGKIVLTGGSAAHSLTGNGSYGNLELNDSLGATLGGSPTVNGTLTLTGGRLTLGGNTLTMSASAPAIQPVGSFTASNMIVADGAGSLCKTYSANGSYTYPIGDGSGDNATADYSPASLQYTSGAPDTACVRVTDGLFANKPVFSDTWITRYWTVTRSGTGSFACTTSFTYVDNDVAGTTNEASMYYQRGDLSLPRKWQTYNLVSAGSNTFGASVAKFSPHTAFSPSPTAVTLESMAAVAAPEGGRINVTWTTAQETDNQGFNLWRGTARDDPDVIKLNAAIIPSRAPGNGMGADYAYTDTYQLVAGTTYYYWLEDVSLDGATTRHEPVSVTYLGPTAVGLSAFGATRTLPLALPLAGAGLAALALAAGAVTWARRRR